MHMPDWSVYVLVSQQTSSCCFLKKQQHYPPPSIIIPAFPFSKIPFVLLIHELIRVERDSYFKALIGQLFRAPSVFHAALVPGKWTFLSFQSICFIMHKGCCPWSVQIVLRIYFYLKIGSAFLCFIQNCMTEQFHVLLLVNFHTGYVPSFINSVNHINTMRCMKNTTIYESITEKGGRFCGYFWDRKHSNLT